MGRSAPWQGRKGRSGEQHGPTQALVENTTLQLGLAVRRSWLGKPGLVFEVGACRRAGSLWSPTGDGHLGFTGRVKSHKTSTGPRTHQEKALYMERNPSKSKASILPLLLSNDIWWLKQFLGFEIGNEELGLITRAEVQGKPCVYENGKSSVILGLSGQHECIMLSHWTVVLNPSWLLIISVNKDQGYQGLEILDRFQYETAPSCFSSTDISQCGQIIYWGAHLCFLSLETPCFERLSFTSFCFRRSCAAETIV